MFNRINSHYQQRLKTGMKREYPTNYRYYNAFGWDKFEIKPKVICTWNRKVLADKVLSVSGKCIKKRTVNYEERYSFEVLTF